MWTFGYLLSTALLVVNLLHLAIDIQYWVHIFKIGIFRAKN